MVGYYSLPDSSRTAMVSFEGAAPQVLAGLITDPSYIGGWVLQTATAINDHQTVVGVGTFEGTRTAFTMDLTQGTITPLGTLDPTLNYVYTPTAVNTAGVIVGTAGFAIAGDADPTHLDAQRAFVFTDTMLDLNTYVPVPIEWVLTTAVGINDNFEIAGVVTNPAAHQRCAFKAQVLGLPTAEVLECAGHAEGTLCDTGHACAQASMCISGACTCIPVTPAVACVAAFPPGQSTAIFSYQNPTTANVNVPYESGVNMFSIASAPLANPRDQPPVWFVPGTVPGAYKMAFGGGPVVWQLGTQTASTAQAPPCTLVPVGGNGVAADLGGGVLVVLQSDTSSGASALRPLVECVKAESGGQFTAYLGYQNTSGAALTLPVGSQNSFSGATMDRGQLTAFLPGQYAEAMHVTFDGSPLSWTLGTEVVTMSAASTPCIPENCAP
jgi:hypothetical protein